MTMTMEPVKDLVRAYPYTILFVMAMAVVAVLWQIQDWICHG